MSRLLRHIAYWLAGLWAGDAAKRRSARRRASNPGLETLWSTVKVLIGIGLVVWLLGFGGMHTLSTAVGSAIR